MDSFLEKNVPVIASFDSEGRISPLYIRINGESHKVHSFWQRPSFMNTVEFSCQIEDNGILKSLNLVYRIKECIWAIKPG